MKPGEEDAGIGLVFAVTQADARVLRAEAVGRDRSILDVIWKRIVRNLE